eukprot:7941428-Pyramimonas_sp.AAC.1
MGSARRERWSGGGRGKLRYCRLIVPMRGRGVRQVQELSHLRVWLRLGDHQSQVEADGVEVLVGRPGPGTAASLGSPLARPQTPSTSEIE